MSQSNVLGVDVLLMIFQQLEGEDLMNCEAVCRQWRDVLLAGTLWRRFFHRKIASSPFWRKAQKKFEKNQQTLQTGQYRDVCRNLLQVERNWCTGQFEKSVYLSDEIEGYHGWLSNITISDDYVAWNASNRGKNGGASVVCFFLDKESNEITKFPSVLGYRSFNEMEVRFANPTKSEVRVRDPKNQWTVNVGNAEENGFGNNYIRRIIFGSRLLVEYTRLYNNGTERMRIWKMGNSPTLIHDRTFENRNLKILKVDEQFIVAMVNNGWSTDNPYSGAFYFFSTETLDEFTSLSVHNLKKCVYDRGLLFQSRGKRLSPSIIRVLDIASGKYYNDVHLPFAPCSLGNEELFMDKWASSNSNAMVIGWKYWNMKKYATFSHLSVYDLEAVKNPNSDHGSHLLYTLQFQFDIRSFVMDETRIAFIGSHYRSMLGTGVKLMSVLNFANFNFAERKSSDLKKNPEDNEDFKMKIIYDPFFDPFIDPWTFIL